MSETGRGDVAALIEHFAQQPPRQAVTLPDGREFLFVPEGAALQEVTSPGWSPPLRDFVSQRVKLQTKDSFVAYVDDFNDEGADVFPRVFLDVETARVEAVMDYHAATLPGRCAHRASLQFTHSEQWTRWSAISGKMQRQAEFARFLEENARDVKAPSGADLLELVRDISANTKADFRQAVRLDNGDIAIEYVTETKAVTREGQIEIPRMFLLEIPVFYGEPSVEVGALLRWTVDGGALALGIELHRPVFVRQSVLEQIALDLADRLKRPVHLGALG